jgi:hypothetical protein
MDSNKIEMGGADVDIPLSAEKPRAETLEMVDDNNQETQDDTESLLDADSHIDELVGELELVEKAIKNGEDVGISNHTLSSKQEGIINEICTLEDEKSAWLKENGEEKLPEGISIAEGKDGWAVKLNTDHKQEERMPQKQRREFIDKWKNGAVADWTHFLQSNWRYRDAINLPIVLDIIKNNVPLAIERKSKKFLDGESDFLPDFVVMRCKANSIFERLTGKPNQIRELKIDFAAGESEILAKENELVKQDEEKDKEDMEEESSEEGDLKQAA